MESKRKFRGFNFYIQHNEKLTRSNREQLLSESKIHLSDVIRELPNLLDKGIISELDSNLTDYELLEQWNFMYDNYGYLMRGMKDGWIENNLKKV